MKNKTKITNSTKTTSPNKNQETASQVVYTDVHNFIPSQINPNNGAAFEGNHNPLSSKGE